MEKIDRQSPKKEFYMTARTEQKAPKFTMPAYRQGEYTEVSLSDYEGKWLMLFFYPGDFTFV